MGRLVTGGFSLFRLASTEAPLLLLTRSSSDRRSPRIPKDYERPLHREPVLWPGVAPRLRWQLPYAIGRLFRFAVQDRILRWICREVKANGC
jgi:hypothetical protein